MFWKRPRYPKPPKGRVWEGQCKSDKKTMHVFPNKDDAEFMWNAIHESLHACFPDLDDHSVDQWEADAKRLVRRVGFKITL